MILRDKIATDNMMKVLTCKNDINAFSINSTTIWKIEDNNIIFSEVSNDNTYIKGLNHQIF